MKSPWFTPRGWFVRLYVCTFVRLYVSLTTLSRSQCPRGLRPGTATFAFWHCVFKSRRGHGCPSVSCECCVSSGRGLWVGLITGPETSYGMCGVSECDRETSTMKRLWLTGGLWRHEQNLTTLTNTHFLNDINFLVSVVENRHIYCETRNEWGTRWGSWLRHCAASRKVAGSIPDGVAGNFHLHYPYGRPMALGLTQPLT